MNHRPETDAFEPEGEATLEPESLAERTGEGVEALRRERDEYLGNWQRAQADYQNLKRRMQSDLDLRLQRSMEPLLRELLLVLDHLDMALLSPAESADAQNLAAGVQLVRRQLATALEDQQVEPIAEGGLFDPEWHRAVGEVEDPSGETGRVLETVRRGYSWRGRALRHSEVRVSRAPAAPGEAPDAG
jgi:molecular chaperone GrpE